MYRPNDPGDFRTHECAGCRAQILSGKLCGDCAELAARGPDDE